MANFNFNKVILGGRLTADPELRTTPSGIPVTSFTIAVNRRFNKNGEEAQADFINATAWRSNAEFISRYFRKASSICIVGSIQTRSWTDQQGNKRFATDVVVDEAMFVDAKSENPISVQQGTDSSYMPEEYTSYGENTPAYGSGSAPKFEEITDDEELPF